MARDPPGLTAVTTRVETQRRSNYVKGSTAMIVQAPAAFRLTAALDGRSRSVMSAHAPLLQDRTVDR